jgi:hypothetical protein
LRVKEWIRASAPLVPVLEGFERAKGGAFVRQHKWVAEIVDYDSSGFSKEDFYVEMFAFPLFIPSEYLTLSYSAKRLNGEGGEVTPDLVAAVEAALPKLAQIATFDGLRAKAKYPATSIRHAEMHQCLGVLTGDETLIEEIREFLEIFTPNVDWARDVLDRCLAFSRLIDEGGLAAAMEELENRRVELEPLLR